MEDGDINILEQGIMVTAKVSLDNGVRSEEIKVIFAPSVVTLLGEVEKLFRAIYACGQGLMRQKLADIFDESGIDGISAEYERSITAYSIISTPDCTVKTTLKSEVGFGAIDSTEYLKNLEDAKNALIRQLLSVFAVRGGH